MDDEQFKQLIQSIHQQQAVLHKYVMQLSPLQEQQIAEALEEIMLPVATIAEELFRQNQQAIARHLVELHNGTIHIESLGVERGTTAIVRLPLLK